MSFFRYSVCLFVFLSSVSAHADELESWYIDVLKKDDPDSLSYFAFVNEACGFDTNQLEEMVEGVLIRSRIKPIEIRTGSIYLNVVIDCPQKVPAFSVSVNFGRYDPKPAVLYDVPYGGVGMGADPSFILGSAKKTVEEAITDYISANFDL